MSLKEKKKEFRFTFQNLIRLVIFSLLIFLLISFFASKPKTVQLDTENGAVLGEEIASASAQLNTNSVLNNLYQKIPEKSRNQIENLNQNPAIISIQNKVQDFQKATNGFPDTQIKEIKKAIVKSIYEDMMRNIDKQ